MTDATKQPGIQVDQIFVNRALLEHSAESAALPSNTPAGEHQINVSFSAGTTPDGKNGIASITVQTTPENKGLYRFIIEVVGFFSVIPGEENMPIAEYIQNMAAPTIFPFLREAVANLTGRGRFGPVWLRPMNLRLSEEAKEPA